MKIYRYIYLLVLGMGGLALYSQESADENEPIEPTMEMTYLKDTHGMVNLRISLVNYVNRQPIPLPGLEVVFYAGEDSLINLGKAATDEEGMAVLILEKTGYLPAGPDGIRYYAEYEGGADIMPADYELYIVEVNLDMKLDLVDSVKTVALRAWSLVDGEEIPVADEDAYVYVARMFADLPLGEDFLDENGEFVVEIPDDIPGDTEGFIEIIARFNDHYLFGTVENRQTIQWGVPARHDALVTERTLWTQIAPVWMIITLTILLTGVWSHYIFVLFQIYRIARLAKKEKQADLV
ncbi:MAG: hypothetical protein KAJ19_16355 [Gammaproteobacteria bacterium]|nr:hypothetical protein [Gammaproteobacteria bacterium]